MHQRLQPRPCPSVSVVVPTRDRQELVRRAAHAILGQDYPGQIECVVVHDQSEPFHLGLSTWPDRAVQQIVNSRSPGLAGARNSGVLAASGELIAFCDDDDEWLPGKLALQVSLLGQHPNAIAVACEVLVRFHDRDHRRRLPAATLHHRDFLRDRIMEVNPCTLLLRRDDFLHRVGLVDEAIPGSYAEDYEWLLRATRDSHIVSVRQPLVRVNWHPSSFFADRWRTIISALGYLLVRHSDLLAEPRGLARIEGQLAFAHAALHERRAATRHAIRALRLHWREQRALVALLVAAGLLSSDRVTRWAHARGRGI